MKIRSKITALLLGLTSATYAQKTDTTYFDADWQSSTKANGIYYRITKVIEEGEKYEVADYYKSGKLQMTGSYASLVPEIKDGTFTWYKETGEKGSEAVYEKGKVKSKKNFGTDPNDKNASPEYVTLEKQPQYPGGMKKLYRFIGDNFNYPKGIKPRIKGTILVNFVIGKDGIVTEAYVKESVHPLLDAEAIRVVESSARWEPGVMHGKPVRVSFNIPISVE